MEWVELTGRFATPTMASSSESRVVVFLKASKGKDDPYAVVSLG